MIVEGDGDTPERVYSDELRKKVYQSSRKKIEEQWYASWDGDIDRVKEILEQGYHDINGLNRWQTDIDPNGWQRTPLHAAVLRHHVDLATYLISEGADINLRTKYGDTPLHFAVQGGDPELVQLLLDHGADSSIKNDDDETPLDLAKKLDHPDVAKLIEKSKKRA